MTESTGGITSVFTKVCGASGLRHAGAPRRADAISCCTSAKDIALMSNVVLNGMNARASTRITGDVS